MSSIDDIFQKIAKKSRKEIFFHFFLANIFLLTLIDIVHIITFIFDFILIKLFVSKIYYFSSWGTFCFLLGSTEVYVEENEKVSKLNISVINDRIKVEQIAFDYIYSYLFGNGLFVSKKSFLEKINFYMTSVPCRVGVLLPVQNFYVIPVEQNVVKIQHFEIGCAQNSKILKKWWK